MADHDDLMLELRRLAREREAVILAHNYQRPEVQDAADHTGDSLELARTAAATDAKVILFCGVHFMAETASILSPEKTVLMPEPRAGCPMANMATAEGLRRLNAEHPEAVVVSYVNTSAEVKAETDVCCTSANAVQVVQRFAADREIIFVPDRNLGDYVNRMTGRRMILWPGYCHVHDAITTAQVEAAKAAHPEAVVLAHPECRREVLEMADVVTSTSGMLREPAKNAASTFIIATETGLLHRLEQLFPERRFVPVSAHVVCPDMKLTTLERCVATLGDEFGDAEQHEVRVAPDIRAKALRAVERMIE